MQMTAALAFHQHKVRLQAQHTHTHEGISPLAIYNTSRAPCLSCTSTHTHDLCKTPSREHPRSSGFLQGSGRIKTQKRSLIVVRFEGGFSHTDQRTMASPLATRHDVSCISTTFATHKLSHNDTIRMSLIGAQQ
eukprot:6354598-Amphidinium_carterae.1